MMTVSKKLLMIIFNWNKYLIQDDHIHEISDVNIQLEEVIQDDCILGTDDNIQLELVIQDDLIKEISDDNT